MSSLHPSFPSEMHAHAGKAAGHAVTDGRRLALDPFFRGGSRARACLFVDEIDSLHELMELHGISLEGVVTVNQCRASLIYHLANGQCADFSCDVASLPGARPNRATCRNASAGFSSTYELACTVLDGIIDASIEEIPTVLVREICMSLGIMSARQSRFCCMSAISNYRSEMEMRHSTQSFPTDNLFNEIENLKRPALVALCALHRVGTTAADSRNTLRTRLIEHLSSGRCSEVSARENVAGCSRIAQESGAASRSGNVTDNTELQIYVLSSVVKKASRKVLRRLLELHHIEFGLSDSLSKLRSHLRKHIRWLEKGKKVADSQVQNANEHQQYLAKLEEIKKNWPWPRTPDDLRRKILTMFREATSLEALQELTCASCAGAYVKSEYSEVPVDELNLSLLECSHPWTSRAPFPSVAGLPDDVMADPSGVLRITDGSISLRLCRECERHLRNFGESARVPPLALANGLYLGPVPQELKDLTVVEEAMIARCRAKCWIVQLKEDKKSASSPNNQRGIKGHIIIYPQKPGRVEELLPPSIEDIVTPTCVIFVGSKPPTAEWLREKAKPLVVRKEKVRAALTWLKENNPLYSNVRINESLLDGLEDEQILPFHIEHQLPDSASETLTSRYAPYEQSAEAQDEAAEQREINFQKVVVTDVDGSAPSRELRAAAVRHIKEKGGGYVQLPHDPLPVNEFFKPDLLPMIYPTLFPYGIGGLEDKKRRSALSFQRHVKHLFSLSDRRFQEHYSFLFTVFNILQRRSALLHTSLKVKKDSFESVASDLSTVSQAAVHAVTERVARGDTVTANSPEERKVLKLMKEVNAITSHVPGSAASRVVMRNEIRALMASLGLPAFYVTINLADIYSPAVRILGGEEIDIDSFLPEHPPDYWKQSLLVARNPTVAAKFFNHYMEAFIRTVLRWDPDRKDLEGGVLGLVKGYYGCVEAQGRGTLHCHMLVWVEGALNPNEIKDRILKDGDTEFRDRLLSMLDDAISTSVPEDPGPDIRTEAENYHPCAVRGPSLDQSEDSFGKERQKDLHLLAESCQRHEHTNTCYKYWRGEPEPKECRFDLDESNYKPESSIDPETGELCLRCLDGLVNNFNQTILETVRCNMDIKFIGSGASAKAILYYITDYITKSQLKAHVAFAALKLAVTKLGEYNRSDDMKTQRAKRLLQKCAYAMISQQELSAPQVISYLCGYGDHYTSHEFRNLFWTGFESFLDKQLQSPECYAKAPTPPRAEKDAEEHDGENERPEGEPNEPQPEQELDDLAAIDRDANIHEPGQDEPNTDEVTIGVLPAGGLIAKGNQVADYLYRGPEFEKLTVWDSVAQIEKVTKAHGRWKKDIEAKDAVPEQTVDEEAAETDDEREENEDPDAMDIDSDTETEDELQKRSPNALDMEKVLFSPTNGKLPRSTLKDPHTEKNTHFLRMRDWLKRFIPVPIGPAIPRRDHEHALPKYCRLMLILFKPWRTVHDLKKADETWIEAFRRFEETCPKRFVDIMNNMQILHECRDSRDDHFKNRYKARRAVGRIPSELQHRRGDDGDFDMGGEEIQQEILAHVHDVEGTQSLLTGESTKTALECVNSARDGGLYDSANAAATEKLLQRAADGIITKVAADDQRLEREWTRIYEQRREQWKQRAAEVPAPAPTAAHQEAAESAEPIIQDQSAFEGSSSRAEQSSIQDPIFPAARTPQPKTIDEISREFEVNEEQDLALRMVCEHSLLPRGSDPLRMYIGGPAGTGKSRVINAITAFFKSRNEQRRLRLASYTGFAAKNIGGMTLHSSLLLNQRSQARSAMNKTRRDLISMWQGVDYLFIDEVSMIGCELLYTISEALSEAKECTDTYGGISIIFAGDFAQLPPVKQKRLYAHMKDAPSQVSTTKGQKQMFGKLLWLQVDRVVLLHRVMRQDGEQNVRFVELLSRLRVGKCTDEDFELLRSRVIERENPDLSKVQWRDAPIIVADNTSKDALNKQAAQAFAANTNQELGWYVAEDRYKKVVIDHGPLQEALQQVHSGKTGQRMGALPLAPGMPVVITTNYDVEAGIVNGTRGILKRIRYHADAHGQRHATSCVIETKDFRGEPLANLPINHAVVIQDETDVKFTHPYTYVSCTIKRLQVPIQPAFCVTAHKAQGDTLDHVIVDLKSCKGTESPYVMVSRAKSLDGLLILRDFTKNKITCNPTEDTRREMRRLHVLSLQTLVKYGSDEQKRTAQAQLAETEIVPTGTDAFRRSDPRSAARVLHEYEQLSQQHPAPGADDISSLLTGVSRSGRKRKATDNEDLAEDDPGLSLPLEQLLTGVARSTRRRLG